MTQDDKSIDNLLELDGERYVIDEKLGLWVKFEVKRTAVSHNRPQGIKYSLTLHDRSNNRIMGFDNSHSIEYGVKVKSLLKHKYDHWHRDGSDKGRFYEYRDAGKLLADFWIEVDKRQKQLEDGSAK